MPIFFEPWIGSEYERNHPRLLILGESHYGEISSDPDATRSLTADYANSKWNHRFWTSIMQVVVGTPKQEIDRSDFWHGVALYNYVQGSAGLYAGKAPPKELWAGSEQAFFTVLERLRPERVLVLSRRLWGNMSSQGASGPDLLLLSGCVSYTDKPTQAMVDQQLRKTKKLVSFQSDLDTLTLKSRALEKKCGAETKTISSLQPTGTGFVGVSTKWDFSVDTGAWPDGSLWVALRTDGLFHDTPIGYRLKPVPNGTEVTVYAADPRKGEEIKGLVEAGTLFCDWQKYSYPYD